jgi:hypothetical protein
MTEPLIILEQLKQLFQGSLTYYGESKPTGQKKPNGKAEYKSWINQRPITDQDWQDHIDGTRHIGTVPIRDDSTCGWGVIDVDRYNINHLELIKIIRERKYLTDLNLMDFIYLFILKK